jgi:DNA mismatch endonuclease (patch repair protein)
MRSKYGFETTGERSKLMTKIKSENTKPEIKLRKALFKNGVRFRIKNKELYGNPDIAIRKYKLIIFIDGEFWHGFNWEIKKLRIATNKSYWIPKIEKNMERDRSVNLHYENIGWTVVRLWDKQINSNLEGCIQNIMAYLTKAKNNLRSKPNGQR